MTLFSTCFTPERFHWLHLMFNDCLMDAVNKVTDSERREWWRADGGGGAESSGGAGNSTCCLGKLECLQLKYPH